MIYLLDRLGVIGYWQSCCDGLGFADGAMWILYHAEDGIDHISGIAAAGHVELLKKLDDGESDALPDSLHEYGKGDKAPVGKRLPIYWKAETFLGCERCVAEETPWEAMGSNDYRGVSKKAVLLERSTFFRSMIYS